MTRLPFDPSRARGSSARDPSPLEPTPPADASSASDAPRPLRVAELAALIGLALENSLPQRVRVLGEISNLSRRNHWYFSLKDADAVVKCVAWASKARSFGFDARDGMQVLATGHVEFYGPQGQTQLYVDRLEPIGAGPLEIQFRALCEELRTAGYFAQERKRPLPEFPRRIAVVTSAGSAALQDVLDTARRRCPAVRILVVDVRVQGPDAAPQIAAALKYLAAQRASLNLDAVLLTRGGGSIEDLWAFNERIVADALFDFPLPIVAAIGHETDTTIAELVADLRCATPSQAAMRLVPDRAELLKQLDQFAGRLAALARHQHTTALHRLRAARAGLPQPQVLVEDARRTCRELFRRLESAQRELIHAARRRLDSAATRLADVRPTRVLADRRRRVDACAHALDRSLVLARTRSRYTLEVRVQALRDAVSLSMQARAASVDRLAAVLAGLDPRSVLHRGYSITRASDGSIIRSVTTAKPGSRISTHLSDGVVHSRVESGVSRPPAPRSLRPAADENRPPPPPQLELFDASR